MAIQIKGISLVQGSRDFHVKGVQIRLAGPTPNNTLPLVDPAAASGGTNTDLWFRLQERAAVGGLEITRP